MAEEPSLPDLPYGPPRKTVLGRSSPRKHARFHHSSSHFSSDPPLFSSDDDPGLDNYADPHRRHKRRYRLGPYSQQHPLTITSTNGEQGPLRKLEPVDSAVWLGSDGTDDGADLGFLTAAQVHAAKSTLPARPGRLPNRQLPPRELSEEERVRKYIEDQLENAKEDIDLSSSNLRYLTNSAIKPLIAFSPLAVRMQGGSFHGFDPALRIYLASNVLRTVPTDIFELEYLSVLSLRNNELVELPEVVCKLMRLKELNIANNALRWLPYSILELLKNSPQLETLGLHPNPFISPKCASRMVSSRYNFSLSSNWQAQAYLRSYVRFMDKRGNLVKGPSFRVDAHGDDTQTAGSQTGRNTQYHLLEAPTNDIPKAPSDDPSTYVSSLEEMCVKAWAQTPDTTPGKYDVVMPGERLNTLLQSTKMSMLQEGRLRNCTICDREYVTARTEWIEWWAIINPREGPPNLNGISATDPRFLDGAVPLIRRGCSWTCLPQENLI